MAAASLARVPTDCQVMSSTMSEFANETRRIERGVQRRPSADEAFASGIARAYGRRPSRRFYVVRRVIVFLASANSPPTTRSAILRQKSSLS